MSKVFAYVGCYTESGGSGRGQGISVYEVDPELGRWSAGRLAAATDNPSFLTVDPRGEHLYCVHGGNFSEISAFAIDRSTGDLTPLNSQPSGGRNPVHLDIEPTGRMMVVANYTEGTVESLPIAADGSLEPPTNVFSHRDLVSSEVSEPIVSQPHHSPFDPAGHFAVVPDKGLDRLFVYRADPETATLAPNDPPTVATHAGAGPRHIAFHPSAPYAYVVNEVDPTDTVYGYDAERGSLQ
ncbi:MAG TPA: beta-propeller fold lactonase family protein, partial [Thermomicrobiales bacterium]|nr:beta-propeller fold lactonase family protein [Thermomicrobiales bacterium]